MKTRTAFSLVELVVVLAIFAILVMLLAPAVMAALTTARALQCEFRLHQMGIAIHNFNAVNNRMVPGLEVYQQPGSTQVGYGFAWHLLLPYLDEVPLWQQSCAGSPFCSVDNNNVRSAQVSHYRCPLDDTDRGRGTIDDNLGVTYGASSYGGNALLFADIDHRALFPQFLRYSRGANETLEQICQDGTSTTILVTEKLAVCNSSHGFFNKGGSAWAYHEEANRAFPFYAAVALPWGPNAGTGPSTRFQVLATVQGECDPTQASTRHQDGIRVLAADGHTATVGRNCDQTLWWYWLTPSNSDRATNFD